MKTKLFAFAFLVLSSTAFAQTTGETSPDSVAPATKRWNIFPVAYYTPETQIGIGIKPFHVRKSKGHLPTDRPTYYSPTLVYTTRKQILTSLTADIWRKHNREHLYGLVEYNDYPYFFFGIGNDSPDQAEEAYTSRTVNFIAQYEQQVFRKVYLGGRYEFKHETIPEFEPDGQLAEGAILGSKGTRSSGLGPVFIVDSRNNLFTPSKGSYHQFSALFFHKILGSKTNFNRYKLDLRNYQKLGPGVFAVQGLFTFVTGSAPFQFLSPLGGVYVMRGLLEGRFRDEDAAVVQADYRFPLFWRIGGAVFGGAGQVSRRIPDFKVDRFHLAGGTGLRYKLNNEGMVVRGDVAFSNQGMYLYFAFAEAF